MLFVQDVMPLALRINALLLGDDTRPISVVQF